MWMVEPSHSAILHRLLSTTKLRCSFMGELQPERNNLEGTASNLGLVTPPT